MQSTLFVIPHAIFGLSMFGIGWVALFVLLALACRWYWGKQRGEPTEAFTSSLPTWGVLLLIIVFLFPRFEMLDSTGQPLGIPIRGYGVMLLLAVKAGLVLSLHRGKSLGLSSDTVLALAFWIFVGGIIGARAFYVIQKWDEFAEPSAAGTLWKIVQFTEGGLVVFGGLIGAFIAMAWFARKRALPLLPLCDFAMPSFLLGQAIGRIGCLLNGCCFGGVCDAPLPAIYFPHGSPPYVEQLSSGELLGIKLSSPRAVRQVISQIRDESYASRQGWKIGSLITDVRVMQFPNIPHPVTSPVPVGVELAVDGVRYFVSPTDLPKYSLATHPAQIYAAIDATLLAAVLWFLFPLIKRDGLTTGLGLTLHSVSRFLLELVRADEGGQFGTWLTIAQFISILLLLLGGALIALAFIRPRDSRDLFLKSGTA